MLSATCVRLMSRGVCALPVLQCGVSGQLLESSVCEVSVVREERQRVDAAEVERRILDPQSAGASSACRARWCAQRVGGSEDRLWIGGRQQECHGTRTAVRTRPETTQPTEPGTTAQRHAASDSTQHRTADETATQRGEWMHPLFRPRTGTGDGTATAARAQSARVMSTRPEAARVPAAAVAPIMLIVRIRSSARSASPLRRSHSDSGDSHHSELEH